MDLKIGIFVLIVACIFGTFAFVALNPQEKWNWIPVVNEKQVSKFSSYSELVAAFSAAQNSERYGGIFDTMRKGIAMPMASSANQEAGGADFSTTNVQVAGVDEADIVKSDGKYIYAFSQNRLIITDAYPVEDAKIVAKIDLNNISPQEMFISGNKLLLFGASYDSGNAYPAMRQIRAEMPYYGYSNMSVARLYDISNKESPVLEKEASFEGSYLTSRLVQNNAFFVINSYPHYDCLEKDSENCIIPMMVENGVAKKVAEANEIGYLPPMPAQNFVTLVSLNLDSKEMQKETIVGNSETIFASEKNIYLAATVWLPSEEIPIVQDIKRIIVGDNESTVINKFSIENGKISFAAQGSVQGHVLNQFSMDEFEENFRIATTKGEVWGTGTNQSTSNLYVLDKDMKTIGKLENLAPGEKIYSARFMGKKAYLVTFKKV
ncbi:MAG: beta-propeller domain-containing protein, partial [Candidatus ainarchaeum sp.]|nr:beta-propeller domain-containing protein [Candidatus ainarchaeum sp.]